MRARSVVRHSLRARLSSTSSFAITFRGSSSEGEPLAEKRRVQGVPTFAEVARRVVEHKHGGWRGRHHAHNWLRSLECYGFPPIGGRPTSKVSADRMLCSSADTSETGNRSRGRGAPATSRPLTKAPDEYHVLGSALTPHAA